jgi:hypothetical protein
MPALGVRFESSKYPDIPAVQTGHPPWPHPKSTISEWTLRRNLLTRVKVAVDGSFQLSDFDELPSV